MLRIHVFPSPQNPPCPVEHNNSYQAPSIFTWSKHTILTISASVFAAYLADLQK